MPVWTEVQAGDMQREQENAYLFRRSASKEGGWAMFCTPVGSPGPITPEFKGEVYARATNSVEWYCLGMTMPEFDALTQEEVGVSTDDGDGAATEAPINIDVPLVTQIGSTCNCTMGNWENEPTEYHYEWTLDGSAVGDDSPDYFVQMGDAGKTLYCIVSAGNAIGITDAPSSNEITITE